MELTDYHGNVNPSPSGPSDLPGLFERLKEKVLNKRPILQSILQKQGGKKLLRYADDYVDVNLTPTIPQRQNEILDVIREVTTARFGQARADSVIRQLEKYYFVSTADHDGPINHPFFVNSNLLTAASQLSHNDPVLQNVIVLACANISIDNSSFPRGLFFQNNIGGELRTHRIPFFTSNERPPGIYTMRPYAKENTDKALHTLDIKQEKGEITADEHACCRQLVEDIYCRPELYACSTYMEQISRTNADLWQRLFAKSNVRLPNLVYLEMEDIVIKLITKYHLAEDTIINHILFDPRYEPFLNTYFEGIFGSFSRAEEEGTYLFWALPKGSRYNLQLWRKGNFLVSKDETYKVELHPEAIKLAMEKREIIPSLLLNFMTVSFYYGLKCLGGFNQVNYLTLMKNAYIKMNVDLGNYRSIEICARAQTREICDGPTFAFLGYANGSQKLALASGVDLIMRGQPDSWSKLLKVCEDISLEEALSPLMPEIYRISYDKKEWEPDLLTINEKDINRLIGLDRKIQPCVTLP